MIRSQGAVPRRLSRKYPRKRPTAMEDGSIRPSELSAASLRKFERRGELMVYMEIADPGF